MFKQAQSSVYIKTTTKTKNPNITNNIKQFKSSVYKKAVSRVRVKF